MADDKPRITLAKRLARSAIGAVPGILLAALVFNFLDYSAVAATVIGVLAALVGVGLAQPEVSAKNVALGTAGMVAAHNAPRFMQSKIIDATMGGAEQSSEGAGAPPK